jgi:hypothetical protein
MKIDKEEQLRKHYKNQIENNWPVHFKKETAKPKHHIVTGILFLILIALTMVTYGSPGVMIVSIIVNVAQWFNAYLVVDEGLRIKIDILWIKIKYYALRFLGFKE